MEARDLYIRTTNSKGSSDRHVRVWDAKRFIDESLSYAKLEFPESKIVVITKEEYRNAN